MIRSLTAPTLHEIIREMHQKGLQMSDIDGTIHTNESGHYYVLFEDSEQDIGAIDTSAGKVGFSAGSLSGATECSVGELREEIALSDTEAAVSGQAVAEFSSNYIVPRTVEISFSGNAPSLKDDGIGNLVDASFRVWGTFSYHTGVPTWNFNGQFIEGADKYIAYKYSSHPNAVSVPNNCVLTRIVFVGANPGVTSIYDRNDRDFPSAVVTPAQVGSSSNYAADMSDIPSIQRSFLTANRKYRWITTTNSITATVLLFWKVLD